VVVHCKTVKGKETCKDIEYWSKLLQNDRNPAHLLAAAVADTGRRAPHTPMTAWPCENVGMIPASRSAPARE